jgi:hypothetical protein
MISKKVMGETTAQAPSCHSSYDNLESDEESGEYNFRLEPEVVGLCHMYRSRPACTYGAV